MGNQKKSQSCLRKNLSTQGDGYQNRVPRVTELATNALKQIKVSRLGSPYLCETVASPYFPIRFFSIRLALSSDASESFPFR